MKVIVAGFSKTGTKSLNAALTQLGYKVYDFPEHFWFANAEWEKMMTFGGSPEKIRQLHEDVDACCDLPAAYFWDELLKLFPQAKVVLTKRDEDDWWRSMQNQLAAQNKNLALRMCYLLCITGHRLFKFQSLVGTAVFGNQTHVLEVLCKHKVDERRARMVYRRHNASVIQGVPKGQLLQYDIKDGWEPLCTFLNVQGPAVPFPHKNVRGDNVENTMQEHPLFKRIAREMTITFTIITAAVGIVCYFLWFVEKA
ncbi:unnamed protein product [Clavelina lepadiformis]|uniref:Uncharacterized protein n=1 Tax=Clavelina lepadiformis TaxID=159417 RepID=A0ABP0EZU3_CLALP